jgi:hypothetical protein
VIGFFGRLESFFNKFLGYKRGTLLPEETIHNLIEEQQDQDGSNGEGESEDGSSSNPEGA